MAEKKIVVKVSTPDERAATLDKLTAWLEDVQARSRVRTLDAENVLEMLDNTEKLLKSTGFTGISKTALEGVEGVFDMHAQTFPNAYNGIPESTQFTAVFRRGRWVVTSIYRGRVASARKVRLTLTDAAKSAIVAAVENR